MVRADQDKREESVMAWAEESEMAARAPAWVREKVAAPVTVNLWPVVHGVGFPVCIFCPNPQYSEEAVKSKYQGVVLLLATITADGRVTNIRVSRGLGVGLDEMAIAAVRTWRFKPALGPDGKPVTVNAPIEVTFRLY